MNKTDLAKCISRKMRVSITDSYEFIDTIQEVFTDELKQNGHILLQGFGVFSPWEQGERPARNPRTGKPCMIAPRISVKFKPGKKLLNELNSNK